MIGVDLIGQIRRAYFEQRRPIKEIVRLLSVSRTTVRKVIRGQETELKYESVNSRAIVTPDGRFSRPILTPSDAV